jgi:hypothetical protein
VSRGWRATAERASIRAAAGKNPNLVAENLVDQPIFLVDPLRAASFELVLERFRLADARRRKAWSRPMVRSMIQRLR